MTSLDKPPQHGGIPVTTTVKWRFPAVHPEGQKFTAIAFGITLLMTIVSKVFFWPFLGITLWVAAFFRDPVRATPVGDDLIVSPADGLVTMIAHAETLECRIDASSDGQLEGLKGALARHLDRFAFREAPLSFDWQG